MAVQAEPQLFDDCSDESFQPSMRCTLCKAVKSAAEFNKNRKRKNGLQNICRRCSQERSRAYYRANPEKHKRAVFARNKRVYAALKARAHALKAVNGCALCPEREPVCLQFHHLDANKKGFEIGKHLRSHQNWAAAIEEIQKCVVLCCNCHRKVHAGIKQVNRTMLCKIEPDLEIRA